MGGDSASVGFGVFLSIFRVCCIMTLTQPHLFPPSKLVGGVIGKNGVGIRRIVSESGIVSAKIGRKGDCIQISGHKVRI